MFYILILTASCFVSLLIGIGSVHFFTFHRKGTMIEIENITENVPNIPIQGFDKEGKLFLWNRASELIYGYRRKEVIGKNIADLLLIREEKAAFFQLIEQICSSGEASLPRQWTVMIRSGQMRTMYSTMFPYQKAGKCEGIFCFDVDITELKRYENELIMAKESYREIFEGVSETIVVYDPNSGLIQDANESMINLFGYQKEEISKLTMEDISYGETEVIRERIKTIVAKAFYEGPQYIEWLCRSKAGRIFPAEFILKKVVIGKRKCLLGVGHDISERKRVEQEVKESEEQYRILVENANDLIFTLDKKGVFTSVNEAAKKIAGYEKNEVIGKHFLLFLPKEEYQKANELFEKIIRGTEEKQQEFKCIHKNKSEFFLLLNAWSMRNKHGEIYGIHAIGKDVTERKLVLDKMRDMVIQTVSMLSQTVSVADRYTEKHCERLAEFSIKIGEKLKLNQRQLENLKYAALLHDVGKVGIPINILVKKEKLTEEEWQIIKEHPQKGADIVRQIIGFDEIAEIIKQHQERIDGKGYPQGLSKDQIKKEATIISVVDAFDAMTSDRPYRKALTKEEAIKELQVNAGTQFDSEVVKAFTEIIQSEKENTA